VTALWGGGKMKKREIAEATRDGLAMLDMAGRVTAVNPHLEEIFGVGRDELVGKKLAEVLSKLARWEKRADVVGAVEASLEGKSQSPIPITIARKKGEETPVVLSLSPLKDARGQTVQVLAIFRDISELKRMKITEILFKSFLEHTPDLVWFMDKDARYIATSKAHADYLGTSPEEMIGKTDLEFYPKEIAKRWIEDDKRMVRTGVGFVNKEEKIRSPRTGKELWVSTTKLPLYDEDGNVIGTFGVSRDITDRKRMETEVIRERNILKAILSALPIAVYYKDRNCRLTYVSRGFYTQYEKYAKRHHLKVPTNVIGKTDFDLFPREWAEKMIEDDKRVMEAGEPIIDKLEHFTRDGIEQYTLTTKVPIFDEKKKIIGLVGASLDMTEQVRLQKEQARALAEAEAGRVASEVVEGMIDGVIITDLEGRILQMNTASRRMCGTGREDLRGKNVAELLSGEGAPLVPELLDKMIETGRPIRNLEATGVGRDGRKFPILVNASLLRDERGEPSKILIVYRDITELKRAQEELEKAYRELKTLDKMKDEFLTMVSHELKTPLTSMISLLQLLLSDRVGKLTERQKECLELISEDIRRLRNSTDKIVKASILESGEIKLNLREMQLGDLIRRVVRDLRPLAARRGVVLTSRISRLPLIKADEEHLETVIINLLDNAIKFTPRGGKVSISARRRGDDIIVRVKDTGPGIPKENIPRLFEKFFQVDPSVPGSGLGLYICKMIVEIHGGRIWVKSQVGKGTTFTFSLPL